MKKKVTSWLLMISLCSTSLQGTLVLANEVVDVRQSSGEVALSETSDTLTETIYQTIETVENITPPQNKVIEISPEVKLGWGEPVPFEKYFTLVEDFQSEIYETLDLLVSIKNEEVHNQTFFAKDQIEDSEGRKYLSLYDVEDEFIGYIENNELTFSETAEGDAQKYNQYVEVNGSNAQIFRDFSFEDTLSTIEWLGKSFFVKEQFYHFNGQTYFVLTNSEDEFLGIVEKSSTSEVIEIESSIEESSTSEVGEIESSIEESSTSEVGEIESSIEESSTSEVGGTDSATEEPAASSERKHEKFVTITGAYPFWESLDFEKSESSEGYKNQTFKALDMEHYPNGSNYLSIYNNQNLWLGYIDKKGTIEASGPQGVPQIESKYVTLKNNHNIWDGFEWKNSVSSAKYLNRTYHSSGTYTHFNGANYLSLYDGQNKWLGYIDQSGTIEASGPQGVPQIENKYVTLKDNHNIWDGFEWENSVSSSKYLNRTYRSSGTYTHFNGANYLSLYDGQNKWLGYIDQSGTIEATGPQGVPQIESKYVTLKDNHNIWDGFEWKNSVSSSKYLNRTYHSSGTYTHFNGANYLSLYDGQNKWLGYIDQSGTIEATGPQGVPQIESKYVTLKDNHNIWDGFEWENSVSSSKYLDRTYHSSGTYTHFNGANYLSLYDGQNKWLGYIDQSGTIEATGPQGVPQIESKYVTLKDNHNIWDGFEWKNSVSSSKYLNRTYHSSGTYTHFNGANYLSLYDGQNKWLGYIDQSGTIDVAGPQGTPQFYGKYVTLKGNYDIWKSFDWKNSESSKKYGNRSFYSSAVYSHFNGSRYLSLYDNNNKWIGYINEKGIDSSPVHLFVMGHGANDPGATGNGTTEREFTRNELLPYLIKYANQLKNNRVIFYDTTRDLFQDSKNGNGLKNSELYFGLSSITEIHLDAGPAGATGGHVIVHPDKKSYKEDLELAAVIGKYNSLWGNVVSKKGLSYRKDLLNLNLSQSLGIPYRLTELGFVSNKKDLALIRANLDKLAKEFIESVTGEKIN